MTTHAGAMMPSMIAIAGPSCAGKTELAKRLATRLSATVLPLDCYYLDLAHLPQTERGSHNFDTPEALDKDLLLSHLNSLQKGQEIRRPVYDFHTHTRRAETELVKPAPFLVVEGLFLLYWREIRRLFSLTIYVDLDNKSCLQRRVLRDVQERGRTPESVILQFAETVRPMAEKYVQPTRTLADLVVVGDAPIENSVETVLARVAGLRADRSRQ